jgi:hypothetical protein
MAAMVPRRRSWNLAPLSTSASSGMLLFSSQFP